MVGHEEPSGRYYAIIEVQDPARVVMGSFARGYLGALHSVLHAEVEHWEEEEICLRHAVLGQLDEQRAIAKARRLAANAASPRALACFAEYGFLADETLRTYTAYARSAHATGHRALTTGPMLIARALIALAADRIEQMAEMTRSVCGLTEAERNPHPSHSREAIDHYPGNAERNTMHPAWAATLRRLRWPNAPGQWPTLDQRPARSAAQREALHHAERVRRAIVSEAG